ncbi:protein NRT1/ PTR FAMILY 5.13-like isoform X2 [Amborella trichopoda]|nr:protein NRT1/ PTR FAMILY 5.13-like isoform X2 [Amborella trichopoda]|eukprot:XP_020532179.1 protein NRT1/ PTR FAMILY 5.13-like isoform X2 [Amborella trichopoda]
MKQGVCAVIVGGEIAEHMAFFAVSCNLISYLTDYLGQSTSTAAKNVNVWSSIAALLPLLGAFVADSFLGRNKTILISSLLYLLGFALLTLSVTPTFRPNSGSNCREGLLGSSPSKLRVTLFLFSIHIVALSHGGQKPCIQAFGADQFDEENKEERRWQSSFFNWWNVWVCGGGAITVLAVLFMQESFGWGLGFGIPAVALAAGLIVFVLGRGNYRLVMMRDGIPFTRIAQVFVAVIRKRNARWEAGSERDTLFVVDAIIDQHPTKLFRWLDKAAVPDDLVDESFPKNRWRLCTTTQVEEVKLLLQFLPICASRLTYATIYAQCITFFTKQGQTMERTFGSTFQVPPPALLALIGMSSVIITTLYDCLFVPIASTITGKTSGITELKRIGAGLVILTVSIVASALVESERLEIAKEHGLLDEPNATVPMSISWLIPQYLLFGSADVFTKVGLQELLYSQMPDGLRSLGGALYLSIIGLGSLLSSVLIALVEKMSTAGGGESWFVDNLNQAHIDYFYWFLALLNTISFCVYVWLANNYIYYKNASRIP